MSIRSPIINFRSFVAIASLTVALTFISNRPPAMQKFYLKKRAEFK